MAAVAVVAAAWASAVGDVITLDPNGLQTGHPVYTIETDKTVYALGEDVHVLHRTTNDGNADFTMRLLCTPGFNLSVLDASGTEVWSPHNVFSLNTWLLTLPPGASVQREYSWDMTADDGHPVAPGIYDIVGVIYGSQNVTVSVTVLPEPSSLVLFVLTLAIPLAKKREYRSGLPDKR